MEREAEERAALDLRLATYPLAAKLAGLLGHPEWVVDASTIKPGPKADQYREALASCKGLGLRVEEHEQPESDDISTFWANVEFEGESFLIDGGQSFRDVSY